MSAPDSRAWVVFTGEADIWWLKFLKPGFRHCYVIFQDRWQWIAIDPMAHYTQVCFYATLRRDFDLPRWLRGRGYKVVETHIAAPPKRCAPPMLFSCVEAVKRLLGLQTCRIITPWQLYKHLTTQT